LTAGRKELVGCVDGKATRVAELLSSLKPVKSVLLLFSSLLVVEVVSEISEPLLLLFCCALRLVRLVMTNFLGPRRGFVNSPSSAALPAAPTVFIDFVDE
jgi:hypothetical protein